MVSFYYQRLLLHSNYLLLAVVADIEDGDGLQSIYVTRDRVFLKFDARVQIYVAVLNIGCEIQNSGGNVFRFSKISSYEISFWLFLFKNMRNIRFLGVSWHNVAVNSRISEIFSEKSSTFRWNVENYKEQFKFLFQFRKLRSREKISQFLKVRKLCLEKIATIIKVCSFR